MFASAFLMPRASVLAQAARITTLPWLVKAKEYWTVSVAALAYRLHEVGAITDWNYRSLYIEIGKRGYRKEEPNSSPRESSQLLRKVLESLRFEGIGKQEIADAISVRVKEVEELIFGLALTDVSQTGARIPSNTTPPKLRLIE